MDIKPMLLHELRAEDIVFEDYKAWFWQEKHNGIRVIIHIKDGKITAVRNRQGRACFNLFPELKSVEFGKHTAILDGELCVFNNSHKSIFYGGINQRDKKFYTDHVSKYPVTFVAFDILFLDGKVLLNEPYKDRLSLLTENFKDTTSFEVIQNISFPKKYWSDVISLENREGLVIKNPGAVYELDTRSRNYLKLKNYNQVDVVIDALESNNKGTKIFGTALIDEKMIKVEAQFGGIEDLKIGQIVPVEYLFVEGDRLIQPHKIKYWENNVG
jgi:ATP-dependent DNA ligase